jgi:hypothetical protein
MGECKMIDYVSIGAIEMHASGHFFDASAKRFFSSRMPQGGYLVDNNKVYFITSEQFKGMGMCADGERAYTIRVMDWKTGQVDTIGEFNKLTKSQANTQLKKIIKENGGF